MVTPGHICVNLAHITSQSKNFDTKGFMQLPCQFFLSTELNLKLKTPAAIATKVKRSALSAL